MIGVANALASASPFLTVSPHSYKNIIPQSASFDVSQSIGDKCLIVFFAIVSAVWNDMPIQYELEIEKNVLRTSVTGFVATKDIIKHLEEVLDKNLVSPGQVAIVNVDYVDVFVSSKSDLAEIENLVSQLFAKGRVYDLFIASDSRSRAMIESLLRSFRQGSVEMLLCHSEQHAEEMLDTIKHQQVATGRYE